MPSAEFARLEKRVDELIHAFADFEIPIERSANSAELDKLAAFRLLTHAEFEYYIEEISKRAINRSVSKWKTTGIVNRCILNLIFSFSDPKESSSNLRNNGAVEGLIDSFSAKAISYIDENNSIKAEAFAKMAAYSGALVDDLEPSLLPSLNSYGSARGDVAHKPTGRVSNIYSPEDEARSARQILDLLKVYEEQIGETLS